MGGIECFTFTIAHGHLAGHPVDESAGAAGPLALALRPERVGAIFLSNFCTHGRIISNFVVQLATLF
jgi:hypothetical protein